MRILIKLLLVVMLFLSTGSLHREPHAKQRLPDVLLITLDTTRADHLGSYGYPQPTSPVVDGLAREGAFFETAFTNAVNTSPSHATILTGLYPRDHGARFNGMRLKEKHQTLTKILRNAGYQTGAFVSGGTLFARITGLDAGFEIYQDKFLKTDRRSEETVDLALDWLAKRNPDKPYFLFVHLFDPHGKYDPPNGHAEKFRRGSYSPIEPPELIPPYQRLWLGDGEFMHDPLEYISRYDGEIHYADSQIGRLLKAVGPHPVTIFAADHGETLLDRDYYFDHGIRLNEEAIHIPLVFRFPVPELSNRRVKGMAQLIDVLPTTLSYLGLPTPPDRPGRNLIPFIRTGRIPEGRPILSEGRSGAVRTAKGILDLPFKRILVSARNQRFKLIRYPTDPTPTYELFDLAEDPGEKQNRVESKPPGTSILYAAIELYLGDDTSPDTSELDELDEDAVEKLRSLGYVD